jgi:glycine cleavage system H protein
MTNILPNLKYSDTDEWFDPATGKIGLSDYAQSQLSDLVFVEILVEPGDAVGPGKAIASVESVKASAEVYSPVSGKIVAVNSDLPGKPESINADPYGAAWLVQVEGGDGKDMKDAAAYGKHCEERAH